MPDRKGFCAIFGIVRCLKGWLRKIPIAPHTGFHNAFLIIIEKLGAFGCEIVNLVRSSRCCCSCAWRVSLSLLTLQDRFSFWLAFLISEPFQLILDVTVIKVPEWIFVGVGRIRRRISSVRSNTSFSTLQELFKIFQPYGQIRRQTRFRFTRAPERFLPFPASSG